MPIYSGGHFKKYCNIGKLQLKIIPMKETPTRTACFLKTLLPYLPTNLAKHICYKANDHTLMHTCCNIDKKTKGN
ncbi:hypothetical protein B7P43_G12309 [Cryptotermes secundus]|uniref:Uncharacterized protein n=1 Tax=Cryptotermes secundus TaxID=105785 RepID=A0A2J7RL34_9NEOP|nr:hypothetical protein B7P43_G12309 [Cryptotermes secundus]